MTLELRMIMADVEGPFAILPHEMIGIDAFPGTAAAQPDVVAKMHEVNTVLKPHGCVCIPSVVEGVDGMLVVKLHSQLNEQSLEVIRMFGQPLYALLEQYNASELLPHLVAPEKL